MVTGHWSIRNYSMKELEEVENGLKRLRQFYKLPETLQRADGKCGSVTYEGLYWFRALCNPKGPTPCCYNNVCANKTVQECQCPQCYDFRTKLHAELADWIPDDPTCKMLQFAKEEDICSALQNATIYLVGDSFMRHLCISVLNLIYQNETDKVYRENAGEAEKKKCDIHYRFVAECSGYLHSDLLTCGNTTRIHCQELWRADMVNDVVKLFRQLRGQNNSWFIFGIGAHDSFNTDYVQKKMIDPLLAELAQSDWPKLVWYEPHSDGLMKSPNVPAQLGPNRIIYNNKVKDYMDQHNVSVLRFFNLTRPVVSYDGSHYGKGVNDVKLQIILNYLLEERSRASH
nr:hypothetical protein BgiMline_017863 [Biomphalaria glabrata]